MCFLLISDQKRYSSLLKKLRDGDNVGRNEYPVTTTSAFGYFDPHRRWDLGQPEIANLRKLWG